MMTLEKAKKLKFEQGVAKGRTRHPETFSFEFLLKRLNDETQELAFWLLQCKTVPNTNFDAQVKKEILLELADVHNFVDYITKKIYGEIFGES